MSVHFLCVEIGRLHLLPRYQFIFYRGECTDIIKKEVFEHPCFIQNMKLYVLLNFAVLLYTKPYRKKVENYALKLLCVGLILQK